jgi:hypothetical protein
MQTNEKKPNSSGDLQSELMNMLKDPNLRNRLKKTVPKEVVKEELKSENMTPEQKLADKEKLTSNEAIERQDLLTELLDYMETPNGSIEDLLTSADENTRYVRTFLYTLVSQEFVKAYRVSTESSRKVEKKAKVWAVVGSSNETFTVDAVSSTGGITPPPPMMLASSNGHPPPRNILIYIAPPPPMMLGSSNGPPPPRNI